MCSKHLRQPQDQVGGRGPGRKRAHDADPEHERLRKEDRLAEHRRLGLDATHTPTEHAEPVDHRRVGIRAHEGVGEREPVPDGDHMPEMLQVHLVADPGARRDHPDVGEGLLGPPE